jgi:hypothetical protein
MMLVAVLFVPFGVYHSMIEPYVTGFLWGFLLPVGYVALASGIAVIVYPRLTLLKILGFDFLLILIGFFLLLSLLAFPKEFFINLVQGTSFSYGSIDIDFPIGNSTVLLLSLVSVGAGFAVKARKIFEQQFNRT